MRLCRRVIALSTATVIAALTACEELTTPLEGNPDAVPLDSIILLTSDAQQIPADAISRAMLSARIPARASTVVLTFATTAGVFVETGTREIKVRASIDPTNTSTRVAVTALRSDTVNATAIVRAAVAEFTDTISVTFVRP